MWMWPDVGGLMSAMAVSSVDLPAPLGPSSATTSPRATRSVTSFIATTSVLPLPIDFREVGGFDARGLCPWQCSCGKDVVGLDTHRLPDAKQAGEHGNPQHDARRAEIKIGCLNHHEARKVRERISAQPPRQPIAERAHEQRLLEESAR